MNSVFGVLHMLSYLRYNFVYSCKESASKSLKLVHHKLTLRVMDVKIDRWGTKVSPFLACFFVKTCGRVYDFVVLGDWSLELPVPHTESSFH
jgi:hypothetical protein